MAAEGQNRAYLDVNALKSVENIRRVIAQYREEQEQLFTKISPETNRPVQYLKEQTLERLFDHCCLISMSRNSGQLLGIWPLALVGSFSTKSVTLGSFDNHGSLWRFVRVDDTHGGVRVVIECSEIGEKPMFLTSGLELTENNSLIHPLLSSETVGYAAEWIILQASSSKTPSTFGDLRVAIRAADDRRYLCCHEQAGVALLIEEELHSTGPHRCIEISLNLGESGSASYWSGEWSIISEDAPLLGSDEFKFLDDNEGHD